MALLLAAVAASMLIVVALPPKPAHAAPAAPIDLGLAAPFAILAGASVGNTATGPETIVRGDLGVVAAAGAVTGFPPGKVRGTLFASGASAVLPRMPILSSAYANAASRSSNFALAGDLIGLTLHPGVHTNVGAVANTGTVTLDGDGDPNAVFIFQVGGALAMAAASNVILTDGTQAKNVFWQVDGAGAIGAGIAFRRDADDVCRHRHRRQHVVQRSRPRQDGRHHDEQQPVLLGPARHHDQRRTCGLRPR